MLPRGATSTSGIRMIVGGHEKTKEESWRRKNGGDEVERGASRTEEVSMRKGQRQKAGDCRDAVPRGSEPDEVEH